MMICVLCANPIPAPIPVDASPVTIGSTSNSSSPSSGSSAGPSGSSNLVLRLVLPKRSSKPVDVTISSFFLSKKKVIALNVFCIFIS
jgi:hypothetical protein